jgi:predicted DNA-binding transcriptional regulator AlpA
VVNRSKGKVLNFPTTPENIPALLDTLLTDATGIRLLDDASIMSALLIEISARQIKLAAMQSALVSARPTTAITTQDRNLTVEDAAARLGVTKQWLYRNSKSLPFTKKLSHRQLRFSERGIERWQKMKSAA